MITIIKEAGIERTEYTIVDILTFKEYGKYTVEADAIAKQKELIEAGQ